MILTVKSYIIKIIKTIYKNFGEELRGFLDRLDFDFSDSAQDGSLWEVTHDGNSLKIKDVNCGICGYEGEGKGNVPCGYGKAVYCGYKIDFGGNKLSESEGWGADSFEGYYQNGVKHGKGIYRFANGTELEGEWENGVLKSGTYNFYFFEDAKKKSYRYTGNFARNNCGEYLPDSAGKILYENGDFYEGDISGDWEHLKKNGIGVFKSVDGRVSDGYFEDDKFYGAV